MGRHRQDPDFDPLRPATVEELAAQERTETPPPQGHRRSLIVALSTSALLLSGAGALAFARAGAQQPMVIEPNHAVAPFGVSYRDGFGEHIPKQPSWSPSPRKSTAKPSVSVTPSVFSSSPVRLPSPAPTPSPSKGELFPSQSAAAPAPEKTEAPATLTAVYWEMTFQDRYWVYIWVNNSGTKPVNWQVDIEMPAGSKMTGSYAVNKASKADGYWTLTPTRGALNPGRTYLLAVQGTFKGKFALTSCAVNRVVCDPFD